MASYPRISNNTPPASTSFVEIHQLKRKYECHLRRAQGLSTTTIDRRLANIDKLADFLGKASIKTFSASVAIKYVDQALAYKNARTGKQRALTTVVSELNHLKKFLIWLHSQPGYKSRIRITDIQYLSVNRKDLRAARAKLKKGQPSIIECRVAFDRMPKETEAQMRDRAMFAMLMLTGARIDALVTLQIRHLNLAGGFVMQCGSDSRTKNSKTFISGFFPIDKIYEKEIKAWRKYLLREKEFNDADPLFPTTKASKYFSKGKWEIISNEFYKGPGQPSRVISNAFTLAIGESHGPHSIRRTITKWVAENTQRQDQLKAASLNLGHTEIKTTTSSYLHLTPEQQIQLVHEIGRKKKN
ncbi:hypothetical protein BFP76_11165 [Amylibacter kogurei]|uniref:Tyr recombinase domain-containing protein n=1 Tax=Paramylibacter kogurei TaxID=1889778 RepID=A0A2G5KBB5_9RHOB|nr:site-specific integrase [Amylibacter kogurei]PIB26469.1 hypothetical protein BFP76_11165 [Amylibacter kogurei]